MQHKRTSRALSADHLALGAIVRQLRARHAVSQEQLGARVGLHRNYVGAIERGEINPTYRTLLILAQGLEVRLSTIVRLCEQHLAHVGSAHPPLAEARSEEPSPC